MVPIFLLSLSLFLATTRGIEVPHRIPVLDTDGKPLRTGVQYLVLGDHLFHGGGLHMSLVNGTCPPHVVQQRLEVLKGQPVMFFPEESSDGGVVKTFMRVYVLMPRPSSCSESTVWKVGDGGYITTGGKVSVRADPHPSRFIIFNVGEYTYQIYSSPCKACRLAHSPLGVRFENGQRLLGVFRVGWKPIRVVFVKVKGATSTADVLPAAKYIEE